MRSEATCSRAAASKARRLLCRALPTYCWAGPRASRMRCNRLKTVSSVACDADECCGEDAARGRASLFERLRAYFIADARQVRGSNFSRGFVTSERVGPAWASSWLLRVFSRVHVRSPSRVIHAEMKCVFNTWCVWQTRDHHDARRGGNNEQ